MNRDATGPDDRLQVLLRIKQSRQGISRQKLKAAVTVEEQRHIAHTNAQNHHDHCTSIADNYVRHRFETKGDIQDVGRFFQSISLGNYSARRDAARALLVVDRVSVRKAAATRERQDAARHYIDETRRIEGLEQFVNKQIETAAIRDEIIEDDTLHEIIAARGDHGKT